MFDQYFNKQQQQQPPLLSSREFVGKYFSFSTEQFINDIADFISSGANTHNSAPVMLIKTIRVDKDTICFVLRVNPIIQSILKSLSYSIEKTTYHKNGYMMVLSLCTTFPTGPVFPVFRRESPNPNQFGYEEGLINAGPSMFGGTDMLLDFFVTKHQEQTTE